MLLAKKTHTIGGRRRWRVDYANWLDEGHTCKSATVTLTDTAVPVVTGATIDTVSVAADGHRVIFWTNGGAVNELFTANIVMTDSVGQVKIDTVQFTVIAP